MAKKDPEIERLLTPSETAAMFGVDVQTVTRWATAGKLTTRRTLGGHRRFLASEVREIIEQMPRQPRKAPGP